MFGKTIRVFCLMLGSYTGVYNVYWSCNRIQFVQN